MADNNPFVDPKSSAYYLLDTGERFLRVTSAIDGLGAEGLIMWSSGLAADMAFEELTKLITATRKMPCGNTYKRCSHPYEEKCEKCRCGICEECLKYSMKNAHNREKSRRADEGTRTHDIIEQWILHGKIYGHDDDIAPYVNSFKQFVKDYGLKREDFLVTEACMINRTAGYAGTMDGIIDFKPRTEIAADLIARVLSRKVRIDNKVEPTDTAVGITAKEVIEQGRTLTAAIDWKTREKENELFQMSYPLQLSAYRNAEVMRLRSDLVAELPTILTEAGVIIQLRPGSYTVLPVVCDEVTFEAFLKILEFSKWAHESGSKAIGKRAFLATKETLSQPERTAVTRLKRQTQQSQARLAARSAMKSADK